MKIVWEFLMILSATLSSCDGEQIPDLTVAFQQYVSACTSSRLCSTRWNVYPPLKSNVTLPAACPQCDCDKSCVLRGTCCPDFLFSKKAIPKCVDVNVIGTGSVGYYMVPSCNNQDSCLEQPFDVKIKNTPVSSIETFYSFQTKESAEKYENPNSLRQWGVEFICNSSVDINFISEYSELLETVKEEACRVMYTPSTLVQVQKCSPKVNTVSHCNMTGLWEIYDPGVDWACTNLVHQSGIFENIFCRLCNPSRLPRSEVSLISVCNETGLWRTFDQEIEVACTLGQVSHLTFPFKNVFCRICNTDSEKPVFYKEVNGFISESTGKHGYIYNVNMTGFADEEVTKLKQMFEADTFSQSYSNMIWRDGQWINKSNLVTQYQAITGASNCSQSIIHSCVCDPSCFEDLSKTCCVDFLLQYTLDFPDFKYATNSSLQDLVTISSCNVRNLFTPKCLNPSEDFLGSFPVTDLSENLHFRSVYCFLCNQRNFSDFAASIKHVVPWNIIVNSPEILNIQFYTSIMDITKIASLSKHDVILTPSIPHWPKRPESGLEKSTCNITGSWRTLENEISWACSSFYFPFETYYNAFCKICNPSIVRQSIYKICNVTRRWDHLDDYDKIKIKSACASFPEISASFPFKNQFCKFCNSPSSTYIKVPPPKASPPATLRDIFSVFSVFERKETKKCSPFHVKDAGDTCREMRCYPGKILTDEECVPLLPITRNLNYTIYFSASIFNFKGKGLPENLMLELFTVIESIIKVNSSNILYHSKAKEFMINDETTIDIVINFFVKDMIQRLESEKSLLELSENPMKYLHKQNPYYYSEILHFLIPNKTSFENQPVLSAEIINPYNVSQGDRPYRNVVIAPIILCKQVELNEFEIKFVDKNRKLIRVIKSDVTLEENDYYVTENESYAVCIDVICADSNCAPLVSELEEALRIFTIVCTVPSLLCLILTFTHYCLFKKLRTLPGIHVMSLTVSLFFSQFFFQFFLRKDFQGDTGCQIVGMIIHYWWLVMFCCYGLNGFLMFMAFRGNITFRSDDRRISKKHFAFSYGLPLAIVLLTVVINLAASGDSGYGLDSICFLNNKVSLIVTFVLLIGIICLWNIVVFCVVVYKLRMYQRTQAALGIDQADKDMFSLFVKLFAISGISWILFLIDAFIPKITVFSFVVTFVNCLQGVLLFCLEVCRKKSRVLYKNFRESRQITRPRQSFSQSRRSVLENARRTLRDRSNSSEYDNSAFSSIGDDSGNTVISTT